MKLTADQKIDLMIAAAQYAHEYSEKPLPMYQAMKRVITEDYDDGEGNDQAEGKGREEDRV